MIYSSFDLGAIDLPSGWFDSGCGTGPRARWLPDGRIEIEGEGAPIKELSSAIPKWIPTIHEMSQKYGVPMSLIVGIMMTESAGQQYAKSYCCFGLMGFLPKTASWYAGRPVTGTELQDNPKLNIELGAKMLAALMNQYKGNVIKVATSYNAGGPYCTPAKGCSSTNRWGMRSDCPGDKTVDYPTRVISYANASIASKGALPVTASSSGSSRLSGWQWAGLAAAGIAGLVWASKSGALAGLRSNPVKKLYEYASSLRPVSPWTVPAGFSAFRSDAKYPHGIVQYTRPLRRADVEHFDLIPLDPLDPINVAKRYEQFKEKVLEDFSKKNIYVVEQPDGTKTSLTYSTRQGVDYQFTYWDENEQPTGHIDVNDFDEAARLLWGEELRAKRGIRT